MPFDNPRDFSEQQLLDKEIKDLERQSLSSPKTVYQTLRSDINCMANTLVYFYEPSGAYRIAGYTGKDTDGQELEWPSRQTAVEAAIEWLNSENTAI